MGRLGTGNEVGQGVDGADDEDEDDEDEEAEEEDGGGDEADERDEEEARCKSSNVGIYARGDIFVYRHIMYIILI